MILRSIRPLARTLSALVTLVLAVVTGSVLPGCTPQCDYPDVRVAKLRLVNAMPDQENITVWLNGTKFWADFPYEIPSTFPFGYFDHYVDGTPLVVGKTIVVVTADAAGTDTLMVDTVSLSVNRETLVVMGRAHAAVTEDDRRKILLLDDQTMAPSPDHTYIRFIHAIPDLPSLDIHWHTSPDGKPNATINYGEANPYSDVKMQFIDATHQDSLIVTEAGNPKNIIALIPYAFTYQGFFLTVVIRGRTTPIGREHSASTFIITDAQGGNIINDFSTFGVRLMNASRSLASLSLLIKAPADSVKGYDPRGNYPEQRVTVIDIPTDSVSHYLPLNPGLNAYTHYTLSTATDYLASAVMAEAIIAGAQSDDRYTIVGVENAKLGSTTTSLDALVLHDTVTLPTNPTLNRVRVVMVSPDHVSITTKIGNIGKDLTFKEVAYLDVPVGSTTLSLSDGVSSSNSPITIVANRPMSLYLLPAETGSAFRYKLVAD